MDVDAHLRSPNNAKHCQKWVWGLLTKQPSLLRGKVGSVAAAAAVGVVTHREFNALLAVGWVVPGVCDRRRKCCYTALHCTATRPKRERKRRRVTHTILLQCSTAQHSTQIRSCDLIFRCISMKHFEDARSAAAACCRLNCEGQLHIRTVNHRPQTLFSYCLCH